MRSDTARRDGVIAQDTGAAGFGSWGARRGGGFGRAALREPLYTWGMTDEPGEVVIDILAVLGQGAIGALIGLVVALLITLITAIFSRRHPAMRIFSRQVRLSLRIFFILAGAGLAILLRNRVAAGAEGASWYGIFEHAFTITLIVAGSFVLVAALKGAELVATDHFREDADSQHARRVRTQMQVIRRVGVFVVVLVAISGVLLTFEQFQRIGTALFASAGLLSIVAGLAAQSVLGNLFAGIQLAFSDALRVGDVVNVNDEFGTVEELTLTYVVVCTWDDRRMVVPTTYFTSTPFQNWTRREAKMLGTVFFDLDMMAPVKAMRVELMRIVTASDNWDGRTAGLQVTDTTGGRMEVRAVVSAATSGQLWDLRCEVREKLVEWIQDEAPYAMVHTRIEPETTTAPTEEERSSFIAETEREWEHEKERARAVLGDTLDEIRAVDATVPAREPIAARRAREAAERRDRRAARKSPGRLANYGPVPARPSSDATQLIPQDVLEKLSAPAAPEASARLYSGSPDAEERGQRLAGPPPTEMAEREAAARRRAHAPEADGARSAEAAIPPKKRPAGEAPTSTLPITKEDDDAS